jgi:hypothetical protein
VSYPSELDESNSNKVFSSSNAKSMEHGEVLFETDAFLLYDWLVDVKISFYPKDYES